MSTLCLELPLRFNDSACLGFYFDSSLGRGVAISDTPEAIHGVAQGLSPVTGPNPYCLSRNLNQLLGAGPAAV